MAVCCCLLCVFSTTDALPEEFEGSNLEVNMAQHLLAAADMYQLTRLRQMCERRLCETVDVETVATTLALAEQNHAEVCSAEKGGASGLLTWHGMPTCCLRMVGCVPGRNCVTTMCLTLLCCRALPLLLCRTSSACAWTM